MQRVQSSQGTSACLSSVCLWAPCDAVCSPCGAVRWLEIWSWGWRTAHPEDRTGARAIGKEGDGWTGRTPPLQPADVPRCPLLAASWCPLSSSLARSLTSRSQLNSALRWLAARAADGMDTDTRKESEPTEQRHTQHTATTTSSLCASHLSASFQARSSTGSSPWSPGDSASAPAAPPSSRTVERATKDGDVKGQHTASSPAIQGPLSTLRHAYTHQASSGAHATTMQTPANPNGPTANGTQHSHHQQQQYANSYAMQPALAHGYYTHNGGMMQHTYGPPQSAAAPHGYYQMNMQPTLPQMSAHAPPAIKFEPPKLDLPPSPPSSVAAALSSTAAAEKTANTRKRKKIGTGAGGRSRADADARATRIRKHNEAEVRRRQRLKFLLSDLAEIIECRKTHKSAVLRSAIERVRVLQQRLRELGCNVSEIMSQAIPAEERDGDGGGGAGGEDDEGEEGEGDEDGGREEDATEKRVTRGQAAKLQYQQSSSSTSTPPNAPGATAMGAEQLKQEGGESESAATSPTGEHNKKPRLAESNATPTKLASSYPPLPPSSATISKQPSSSSSSSSFSPQPVLGVDHHSLFHSSPIPLDIIDQSGNILDCNEAFARFTGQSNREREVARSEALAWKRKLLLPRSFSHSLSLPLSPSSQVTPVPS